MSLNREFKAVFCINTGRSGSDYLSTLFKHVENCDSFHEPEPIGNGKEMREYLLGNQTPIYELTKEKVKDINNVIGNGKVYIETNHCFIKGFGWFVPEFIDSKSIAVIILARNKDQIINSLMRIEKGSPLLMGGRKWYMAADKKNPMVPPPKRYLSPFLTYHLFRILKIPYRFQFLNHFLQKSKNNFITRYERECFQWYVDEVSAMSLQYQQKFPDICYYPVDVSDLNNKQGVKNLLNNLGLKPKKTIDAVIGLRTNLKR